ncbi:site-specific DNA-methyltransferase [Sinorhizobium meliloti]|nr:site-specific DNA-methyltransferase [Sinorhizobium meliloti]
MPAHLANLKASELTRDQLLEVLEAVGHDGIRIAFSGKTNSRRLARNVRPRVAKAIAEAGFGDEEARASNLLIEGDNLQSMVTLYKERGRVDLIVTDPPYNTGLQFRYNDKWDEDPNDPGIGEFVSSEDGARRTKWMRFMWPRLQMMKSMLRLGGVLAICIDHRELFRLGQMLDELFGEENRLAIINWQKSAAPRPDNTHISTSTEYVLVYAKDLTKARTASLERGAKDNKRYGNHDNDPEGDWREGNLTAKSYSAKDDYAIQSPFTGEVHYPAGNGAWRHPKKNILKWLAEWGCPYEERDIGDGKAAALMLKGKHSAPLSEKITKITQARLRQDHWPFLWFGRDGLGRPRVKTYLKRIRKGKVPVTYWADEDLGFPTDLDSTSWDYAESGRSSDGVSELTAIVGKGHGFTTVKPLKLITKIIQIWCPQDGFVLDPFAGSGTTGHAVMTLNAADEGTRRFVLMEQGRPENGDSYARSLTADRLKRVCSGDWAIGERERLESGFNFIQLGKRVDGSALLQMEREEMVDTVIASHFDSTRRRGDQLVRIRQDNTPYRYLVAKNADDEGFFLVWDGAGKNTDFTEEVYEQCAVEAERACVKASMYHIYARLYRYQTEGIRFYQIPDRILADFGLDVRNEPFAEDEADA